MQRSRVATWAGLMCLVFCLSSVPRSQGDDDAPAQAASEARDAIVRAARGYQLSLGHEQRPLEMQPEPVLRWPNAVRGTPEGATFVWTLDGRPEAIACIWQNGSLSNAFHSLGDGKVIAQYGGRTVWHSEKPGLELKQVPKSPPPADSAIKRLSQMKDVARRFTCRLTEAKGEELRLLPRPLYRYKTDRPELFDG